MSVAGEVGMGVEDAVMVGDRRYDVEAARTCNVPCVGVESLRGNLKTGGAWLSSARVVRCWVKSRNERNPFRMLPSLSWGLMRYCLR